jgi:hypothetical protein
MVIGNETSELLDSGLYFERNSSETVSTENTDLTSKISKDELTNRFLDAVAPLITDALEAISSSSSKPVVL